MPVTAGGTTSGNVISARKRSVALAVAIEQQGDGETEPKLDQQGNDRYRNRCDRWRPIPARR